jgi:type IV pilus assembly protein PilC
MGKCVHHYKWTGINRFGEKLSGVMQAESIESIRSLLNKQEIIIKTIVKKRQDIIKTDNLITFSRQMTSLLKAGLSLTQSLAILHQEQSNQSMGMIINKIKQDVTNGSTFAEALRYHAIFNQLFCNLIEVGEHSGLLSVMLERITLHYENMAKIKKKIKKAFIYPTMILSLALLITIALLIIIVPQFELLFKNFDAELPLLTRCIFQLSMLLREHWAGLSFMLISFIFIGMRKQRSFKYVPQMIESILFKLPVFNTIVVKGIISRFSRTLSLSYAAGVPLVNALMSAASTTGYRRYEEAIAVISTDVSNGHRLQQAMRKTALFPGLVIQMIAIGEESGTLDEMLNNIADRYDEEIEQDVNLLISLLDPALMLILGLLIGGLMAGIYLPILQLGAHIS